MFSVPSSARTSAPGTARAVLEHEGERAPLLGRTPAGHPADLNESKCGKVYDPSDFNTHYVFCRYSGTVLQSRVLWKETGITGAVYLALFWTLSWTLTLSHWEDFDKFVGKERSIRAFLAMFSTLIGLLLTFYTSLNIARWWNVRLGVQSMQKGCCTLTTLLATGVTKDKDVLGATHRFARSSLYLIFAGSQQIETPIANLVARNLLTQNEADVLRNLKAKTVFPQAHALWTWLSSIVAGLHKQGLTAGPPHYCSLLAAVHEGQDGLSRIETYLETPIPLMYLHLLGLMVKLHNTILACLMAMLSVKHLSLADEVSLFRSTCRAFFMPFLYNAILVINADMSDPFNGDVGDFNFGAFDRSIEQLSVGVIDASEHQPDWMSGQVFAPQGV